MENHLILFFPSFIFKRYNTAPGGYVGDANVKPLAQSKIKLPLLDLKTASTESQFCQFVQPRLSGRRHRFQKATV